MKMKLRSVRIHCMTKPFNEVKNLGVNTNWKGKFASTANGGEGRRRFMSVPINLCDRFNRVRSPPSGASSLASLVVTFFSFKMK